MDKNKLKTSIKSALREDIGPGDITTKLLFSKDRIVRAVIISKADGVVAGMEIAALVFKVIDKKIAFKIIANDGNAVKKGEILAQIKGSARAILAAKRTALNFLGELSGIATTVSKFVKKAKDYKVKIMDTRKTTPNMRYLEKYAVKMGGGHSHRMGLYDQVLIKDSHLALNRSKSKIKELLEIAKKQRPKGMKVEIEVRNLHQFDQALNSRPDIIMLDNMSIKDIRKAVKIRNRFAISNSQCPKIEVSGNVSIGNVRQLASTGVDRISIGSLTHSAKSLDIALKICNT